MSAHRYFRIACAQSNGGGVIGLTEVQLRTVSGGSDVTGAGQGTPFSSGNYTTSFPPANAFDNSTTTEWISSPSGANALYYIGWDFGAGNEKDIVEVVMSNRFGDINNNDNQAPKNIRFEWSDNNVDWVTDWVPPLQTAWSKNPGGENRTFTKPTVTATSNRWRIYITSTDYVNGAGIALLEWRTTRGGTQQATGGTPLEDSEYSASYTAAYAYDTDPNSHWATPDGSPWPHWIGYQFTSAINPLQIVIQARNTESGSTAPRVFYIQQSADGNTWVSTYKFSVPSWTSGESRTMPIPQAGEMLVSNVRAMALAGASDAYMAVSNIRTMALSGAFPGDITVSNVRVMALVKPTPVRLKAFPQIIGG